ncbi:MAG: glutamate-cysteine ligase family protein [Nannocystaceae bacterium]
MARDQLTEWLEAAARPDRSAHLVGTELENFGLVERDDGGVRPVSYEEHVGPVFQAFIDRFGWRPGTDRGVGGELIALERDRASITLEPGGQFELSGKPLPHVHATCEEFTRHYNELHEASLPLEIAWLAVGFHPLAKLDDIRRMPKGRYAVMREYLPTRGGRALDMMHRTCTVQANFDYADERQCGARLRAATGLSALVTALFANSPLREGKETGRASERSQVWTDVDPDRCGLHPLFLDDPARFSFERYVEWALEIPMFFVRREGRYLAHHRTFAQFLEEGFTDDRGVHHRATAADWKLHLNTLFPEARLNPFIEVRGADAVGSRYVCALPALWKGVLYDDDAMAAAWQLVADLDMAGRLELWAECRTHGLESDRVRGLCAQLLAIARESLDRGDIRDSKGRTEARFLDSLDAAVAAKASPGQLARDELRAALARGERLEHAVVRVFHFAGATFGDEPAAAS